MVKILGNDEIFKVYESVAVFVDWLLWLLNLLTEPLFETENLGIVLTKFMSCKFYLYEPQLILLWLIKYEDYSIRDFWPGLTEVNILPVNVLILCMCSHPVDYESLKKKDWGEGGELFITVYF